ncbi:MAG: CocE/NonD family hydrolase [Steroidobacteraceae bacterium]|jgi:dienelactone hydrolase
MRKPVLRIWIVMVLAFIGQSLTAAAATDITRQTGWLKVPIGGREFRLAVNVFRPFATGPFPLVVINHGIPVSSADARNEKVGFTAAAAWFAGQGYVVVVALRPGFGESDGPYLEPSGPCSNRDYVHEGRETAAVESAIVLTAAQLPGVDPKKIIVVGHSAGGFGAIALADAPPPGVVGIINFAGGRGGDDHEHICSGAERLAQAAGAFGRANQVPQLWLYAPNDHFFPPKVAQMMLGAYQAGSKPAVRFVGLPPFDGDGHRTLGYADPSVWANAVSTFLTEVLETARQEH